MLAALKSNVTEPGLYFFPRMAMTKKPTDAEDAPTRQFDRMFTFMLT